MDCNVFNIEFRRSFRLFYVLAVFILIAASCTKGGSREVSLRPRRITFESEGGVTQVQAKFQISDLVVYHNSFNYTDKIGDVLIDFADLSDSYVFDWITIKIIDNQARNSFTVQAEKNDSGKERKLLLAVYALDNMYSLSEIRQR